MALLLGCDYNLGGVAGVGREAVSKLFSVWGEGGERELERVLAWRSGMLGSVVTTKTVHCSSCGHQGSAASHRKAGCGTCRTSSGCSSDSGEDCPCDYHLKDNLAKLAELNVLNKAVASPGWPFENVVEEFYRSDQLNRNRWFSITFLLERTVICQPASAGPDPTQPTSWTSV